MDNQIFKTTTVLMISEMFSFPQNTHYIHKTHENHNAIRCGAMLGGYREHDILVIDHEGGVENITKFPFGPEHNIIPL